MLGRLRFLGNIAVCCPTSGVGRHLCDDVRCVRGASHPHKHLHHCNASTTPLSSGVMRLHPPGSEKLEMIRRRRLMRLQAIGSG
ncbi:hypothetical protein O3P69_004395 [Scylla paramamosain]|uniref:Secreted protein n=1 Tax=Scylla paramamosain TaxID=85552 RepID=A0AAW0UBU5_SCYPA